MIEDEGKKMPNKKKKYTSKRARVERNRLIFIISVVVVICIAVILAIIFWNPDKSGEGGDSSLSSCLLYTSQSMISQKRRENRFLPF